MDVKLPIIPEAFALKIGCAICSLTARLPRGRRAPGRSGGMVGIFCAALALAALAAALNPAALKAAAPPIRIGATISLSGKYTEPSRMIQAGYRLWEKQINARGGLLNRPVELILPDDHSRVADVRQAYRRLIETDAVDLLLSPYGSPLTLAASEISESNGYVMLACAASADILFNRGYRHLFGVYAPAKRYFIGLMDLMARHSLQTVAILYEDSPFNRDVADGTASWAHRFGLQVAFRQSFSDAASDLPHAVAELQRRFPAVQGLVFAAYPPDCYRLLDILAARGWRPPVLAQTIAPIHPQFYQKAGPMAEGVFGPSQWEPDERIPFPGTRQFIRDFEVEYGMKPSYHAAAAYTACQIMENAVTRTGTLDQEAIRNIIAAMDSVTVIGRFKVDSRGMQIGHNPFLIQWQDGQKEIVYPRKLQTATPRFFDE